MGKGGERNQSESSKFRLYSNVSLERYSPINPPEFDQRKIGKKKRKEKERG